MSSADSQPAGPGAQQHGLGFAERNLRWNYSFGVADGAFFGLFLVLADVNLVLPWLLSQLTTAKWIIGLPPMLTILGGSLPQILAAHYVQKFPYRRLVVVRVTTLRVIAFGAMLPFLFWQIGGPEVTLLGVLIPFTLACLALSFVALPWNEMTAKTIPPRRLSSFFGTRGFVSGLLGLGASWFIGSYLGAVQTVPLPRFGVVLGLAVVALALSQLMNAFVREPPSAVPEVRQPIRDLAVEAARVSYQDSTFRYFMLTRALLMLSSLTAPFYIVEGRNHYRLLADSVGTYTFVGVAAGIAMSLGWSLVGDRVSMAGLTRIVGALSAVPALLALAMPVVAAGPIGAYGGWLLVFLMQGAATSGQMNVNYRGMIELPIPAHRAQMLGAGNTFYGLVSLFGPLIGLLADLAGAPAAFALAVGATVTVTLIAGLLRPRTGIAPAAA